MLLVFQDVEIGAESCGKLRLPRAARRQDLLHDDRPRPGRALHRCGCRCLGAPGHQDTGELVQLVSQELIGDDWRQFSTVCKLWSTYWYNIICVNACVYIYILYIYTCVCVSISLQLYTFYTSESDQIVGMQRLGRWAPSQQIAWQTLWKNRLTFSGTGRDELVHHGRRDLWRCNGL